MLDIASESVYSVNNYLKNMDMQNKWEHKQRTGNYASDGIKTASEWAASERAAARRDVFEKKAYKQEPEQEQAPDKDEILEIIKNKLSSGGWLTESEMRYAESKDKALFQQAVTAENERKIYEHELRMCRTKEDVHKFKMNHTAYSAERLKSAVTDPSKSDEEKMEAAIGELNRMSAVNRAERDFVRSGEYSRLPSQAEKLKAERDLRRAKKEESRAAAEKRAEKKAEAKERAEKARQKRKEERAKLQGKKVTKLNKKKKKFKAKKARYTTAQALNTAEAKKVRRANAKADYEMTRCYAARAAIAGNSDSSSKSLDVTA